MQAVGMQAFFQKLMRSRKCLKQWNYNEFGNINQNMHQAQDAMLLAQLVYHNSQSIESKIELNEVMPRHSRELAIETEFWRQKSSVKWL